jgi:pectinesterase
MRKILTAITPVLLLTTQICLAEIKMITIGLIGDSTVAEQSGWGPALADRLQQKAKVVNHAVNGATLESLSKRLDDLIAQKPDYVMIQFGHNDQKRYGTDVYREHLQSYVERIQRAGAKPIIVSSVTRRNFDATGKIDEKHGSSKKSNLKGTLADYAKSAQGCAAEKRLPFIDLYRISIEHHNRLGREASMSYNWKDGDTTHFNKKGTEAIADLIVPELNKIIPQLVAAP